MRESNWTRNLAGQPGWKYLRTSACSQGGHSSLSCRVCWKEIGPISWRRYPDGRLPFATGACSPGGDSSLSCHVVSITNLSLNVSFADRVLETILLPPQGRS